MSNTILSLTDEQAAYIKSRAQSTGKSEEDVIREAIDRLAEAQPVTPRRPRSFGAFASDNVRGRDFDEWLAANWERDW